MEQDREEEDREPAGWAQEQAAEAAGDGWGDLSREPGRAEDVSAPAVVPPPLTKWGFPVTR